jgi:TRAP-type transport system periplasmic protein
MAVRMSRRAFAVGASATAAGLAMYGRGTAADPFRLRCSLDTVPSHMRNQSMADYLKKIEAGSGGRIKTELFSAGALFADVDVSKALIQGQMEMAAPGSWVLTGFIPDCDLPNLPIMYGQPAAVIGKALDGKTGKYISGEIQTKLRARTLGPWLTLGFQHWYTSNHPLKTFNDLKGLKIRNPGGGALAWRTRFFEAIPNITAWPGVPLALSQGTVDGLITTNESSFSSKLWEAGLKYSLQDHQNVNSYVPLVSDAFYTSLPADLQTMLTELWAQNIGTYRQNMLGAQDHALEELQKHGLQTVVPTAAELSAVRNRMMASEDHLVKELKISPQLPKLVAEDVGSAA